MLLERFTKHPFRSTADHIFQVRFVWQVWDGQLSPSFKYKVFKAFGGWKCDRGTAKLHARILPGKGCAEEQTNHVHCGKLNKRNFCPISVYIYIYTSNHMYVYVYVNVYVFACVYIYIYIHIP